MTEWRPVVGYEGYDVSSDGQVRSWRKNKKLGRLLKPTPDSDGYPSVSLWYCDDSGLKKGRTTKLATIVALAFIGPRPDGQVVRHMNGDKNDNTVGNLEYGTVADNIHDQMRHGTHRQLSKTHCPQQHPLIPGNLVSRKKGGRDCLICHRLRQRARYRREHGLIL